MKERLGHFAKVYKECLSGGGNQESLNESLNLEESRSPQKDLWNSGQAFFGRQETDL